MSYVIAENALKTLIEGISGYSSSNVSIGDYRILKAGITKAVVLQPGAFSRDHQAFKYMRTNWLINIEMYIPFGGEMSTVATNLRACRQEIIDQVDKYPTLNGASGVVLGLLSGGNDPEVWSDNRKYLWRQVMTCMVEERQATAFSE